MDSYGDDRLKRSIVVRLRVKVIYSQVTLSQENVKPSQLVWPGLHFSKDNVA